MHTLHICELNSRHRFSIIIKHHRLSILQPLPLRLTTQLRSSPQLERLNFTSSLCDTTCASALLPVCTPLRPPPCAFLRCDQITDHAPPSTQSLLPRPERAIRSAHLPATPPHTPPLFNHLRAHIKINPTTHHLSPVFTLREHRRRRAPGGHRPEWRAAGARRSLHPRFHD